MDKDQRLDEGRVEAEDGKLDYEDSSDDEEAKLLPHRKGADEPDPSGADIRDVPEASGTQREEWFLTTEPLNGARPKWNSAGRPPVVPEQTRALDAEATGGIVGRNIEHRGAPTPLLPLDRQNMQEAEVVTPLRKEANGHRGRRAPESQLPPRGTPVAPQIFTDARTRDVSSDRRNVAWSPENILVDTVARLQQDLADIRAGSRQLRTPGVPPVVHTPRQVAFTTTKVPRFGGTTSWEHYRQVFDAIVLSNGWDDATAALQLLSHLEGDALNVALLVPMSHRTSTTDLVDTLSAHYGSPGRLADYRRQFEKTTRSAGEDPSIFAITLETLAVKAFGDMSSTARLRLIRDRSIAGHSSCELRRYLDSVPPETPIRDVVDRFRVWESHADPEIRRVSKPGPEPNYPAYVVGDSDKVVEEVYSGSGGGFAQTTAGGCGSPGSGPSSGSGSSDGGKVVAASGGGNADSPAYSCGGTGACVIGNVAQIVTLGAAGIGAAASAGILPA